MTVLEYLKILGLEVKSVCVKVDELKKYIGRPVWNRREKQWRIIKSVVYFRDVANVDFTDGTSQQFPRGLQETWLQVTEGGDTVGQENIETIQGAAKGAKTE